MTQLAITVKVGPGTSPANSTFIYTSTSPCLRNDKGSVTLPADKVPATIRFQLGQSSVVIGGAAFKLSFPANALDIKDKSGNWPPAFSQPKLSGPPGQPHDTVEVVDQNQDADDYKYALEVNFTPAGGVAPIPVADDPRIKNGGDTRGPGSFWTPRLLLTTLGAFLVGFALGWMMRGG